MNGVRQCVSHLLFSGRLRAVFALALTALSLLSLTSSAGVPLVTPTGDPYRWDLDEVGAANVQGGKISYYIDPNGPRRFVQGDKTHQEARRDGILAWEIGTSSIRFVADSSRPASRHDGADRVNYVGFGDSDDLGPLTLAITYATRAGTRLVDSDTVLNDQNVEWSSRTPGLEGTADVESLVAHEWGHAIGLDHVPLTASTMYFATVAGQISQRSLADDDRAIVGTVYPNSTFQQTTGSIAGRVEHAETRDDRGIHVIAISVATLEPAGSTLSDPNGEFRIDGLAQGAYRLLAAPTVPLRPAMNDWWLTANASFLPTWLRVGDSNPGPLVSLSVTPGQITRASTMVVHQVSSPLEPDNVPTNGSPLELGDGACARLERGGDFDVYVFEGRAGQIVTAAIYAFGIGADCDPALALLRISGQPVASNPDIRARALHGRTLDGPDLDARVLAVSLPADDTYFLRVSRQNSGGTTNSFYALAATVASNAPSSALTEVRASPDRLDAGGSTTTQILVTPKRETGEPLGNGATVELTNSGSGQLGPIQNLGDGTYSAVLTSALQPGTDRISVTVTTGDGVATLQDAVLVVYLGPIDPSRTSFASIPRRIDADGASQATVVLQPRDARGESLGTGRIVRFALQGGTGGSLGSLLDLGDGSYAASVRSASSLGFTDVRALVDGLDAGVVARVVFGFPLEGVLLQSAADIDTDLVDETVKSRALGSLKSARKRVDKALAQAALGVGDPAEPKALQQTSRATKKLLRALALSKGTLPDRGTAGELARAVRDAARAAADRAIIVTGQHQKRVDQARFKITNGQEFYNAGLIKKALTRWLKAFKQVRKLSGN